MNLDDDISIILKKLETELGRNSFSFKALLISQALDVIITEKQRSMGVVQSIEDTDSIF